MSQSERGVGFIFPVPHISKANKSVSPIFFSFVFLPHFPLTRLLPLQVVLQKENLDFFSLFQHNIYLN